MQVPMSPAQAPTGLDPELFAGVLGIIQPQGQLQEVDVTDDLDGEGETLGSTVPGPSLELEDGNLDARVADLLKTVNEVSKGVSERTHDEYQRYVLYYLGPHRSCSLLTLMTLVPSRLMAQCEEFLTQKEKLLLPGQFFCERPLENAPSYIAMWIMNESVHFHFLKHGCAHCMRHRCDELHLNGEKRLPTEVRATYGTAQKMRASMTYAFGRIHGLGSMHWQQSPVGEGMVGNPSVSEVVSRYMLSLRRRKVQAGETPTSARAISEVRLLLWWGQI